MHAKFPGKLLAYNCSPSFNWAKHLKDEQIATFQQARAPADIFPLRHTVPITLCSLQRSYIVCPEMDQSLLLTRAVIVLSSVIPHPANRQRAVEHSWS